MKILYIVPSLAYEGPIFVVRSLVRVMTEHGHYCKVVYFDEKRVNDLKCDTEKINFFNKTDFSKYDVVHSHGLRPDAYVFMHKPFSHTKTMYVTTMHNLLFQEWDLRYGIFKSRVCGHIWLKLTSRHDTIISLTNIGKSYYSRWINSKKIRVAYNTISINDNDLSDEEKKQIIDFKQGRIVLGINCRLTRRKGIDMIIKALKKLDNYCLTIVGDGDSMDELVTLAESENVRDRVLFVGRKEEAFRYLPYYDIFMATSRSEGFGLSLVEGMAFRKSIVCSDIPVFKELVTENEVSFFELENIQLLTNAIIEATTNYKGENAYNRYIRDYLPEKFYKTHIDIYTNSGCPLLEENHTPNHTIESPY